MIPRRLAPVFLGATVALGAAVRDAPRPATDPRGISGRLRAIVVPPDDARRATELGIPSNLPGIYPLAAAAGPSPMTAIVLTPFSAKLNGRIGRYRIGAWPNEERAAAPAAQSRALAYAAARNAYDVPRGFVEVDEHGATTHVSESFTLGEFLTHGQVAVWPKYLVLDLKVVDKLELLLDELRREGHPVKRLAVMSGFRTPDYNAEGVGEGGRSSISRHMYGDAADVFPDDDHDNWTDDLNHDGKVDLEDARVMLRAAEAVEAAHPELVGGLGLYRATSAHGPFLHVDTRGARARW